MNEVVKDQGRDLALLVYILQAVGFFIGLTWIVGVIINYVKRDEVEGTLAASHFAWQIKTFWVGFIAMIISSILMIVLIGFILAPIVYVWCIYRVVKGWLALNDGKELGTGWF